MNKKQLAGVLITTLLTNALFATTIVFQSSTPEKQLNGRYEVHKTDAVTWTTDDGKITGHKIRSLKQTALTPGVRIYEGIQKIEQVGKSPLIVHFLGRIESNDHEHGIYTATDEKNNVVVEQGTYEYN